MRGPSKLPADRDVHTVGDGDLPNHRGGAAKSAVTLTTTPPQTGTTYQLAISGPGVVA